MITLNDNTSRESSAVDCWLAEFPRKTAFMIAGDILDGNIDGRKAHKGVDKLTARNQKIKDYYNEGKSAAELGRMFGLSTSQVSRLIASLGCKSAKELQEDRDAVIARLHQFGRYKAVKISKILGISPSTVSAALKRRNIPHKRNKKRK